MTTQTKHTPLPWEQGRNHPCEIFADLANDCARVAHCGDIGRQNSEDNAAFIVQTCNAHYQLVEACRSAVDAIREEKELQASRGESVASTLGMTDEQLRQALALAEKGQND